uniref:Pyridine nucleotide-disulphide oxidoreductase, putative n=1 Tax=Solanum demissum TaxID=50514 RepID=Q60D53_SOLDE|nr:Pyridine nucleotide-disulphide oxidoreductase, putative [Solanum demissum]
MENPPEWGDGGRGRRVVVIGGGVAGSLIAKSLQFDADLTLIDPKDYFEIPWARLRATVEPLFAEISLIHHKDYLANGPTGHYDPLPVTRTDRLEEYQTENEKIKATDSILIVGGGPTGVELAAEIAVDFPQKKNIFHLVWGNYQSGLPFSLHGKATEFRVVKGDMKVDENLRIKGHRNIFVVGDITDIKNLKLLMRGGKESKLAIYEPRPSPKIIVSLGRQDAVAQFSFTMIIGLVPGMIKSKDLYVGKTRKKLGLQPK